ncbi:unnamed protein product, partial [Gongylonema pulchrum]|uniref:GDNF domain-containing protein n=1 Tax=Gongylonema pulchrum TaxID=637853 RepID=A0A183CUH9_9BILA
MECVPECLRCRFRKQMSDDEQASEIEFDLHFKSSFMNLIDAFLLHQALLLSNLEDLSHYIDISDEIGQSGNVPPLISFLPRDSLLLENQTTPERFKISSRYYTPHIEANSQYTDDNKTGRAGQLSEKDVVRTKVYEEVKKQKQLSKVKSRAHQSAQFEKQQHFGKLSDTKLSEPLPPLSKPKDAFTQTDSAWINRITAAERQPSEADAAKKQEPFSNSDAKMDWEKTELTTAATRPALGSAAASTNNEFVLEFRITSALSTPKSLSSKNLSLEAEAGMGPQAAIRTQNRSLIQLLMWSNVAASTCVAAHHRCERSDSCKWHMSEVQIRCAAGYCNRQQCAEAVQRFARYVARPSVESLMFCYCDKLDSECFKYQYCPVHNGQCSITELDHCRQAIIAVRGTHLDYPCYCLQDDALCLRYQAGMLPNSPCIEKSIAEYSRLMSDILPLRQSSVQSTFSSALPGTEDTEKLSSKKVVTSKDTPEMKGKILRTGFRNKTKTLNGYKWTEPQVGAAKRDEEQGMEQKTKVKMQQISGNNLDSVATDFKLTEQTEQSDALGNMYEINESRYEEIREAKNRLEKDGEHWISATTTASEREMTKAKPELEQINDTKKNGGAKSTGIENKDFKIVNVYKIPIKQSPVVKSFKSKQTVPKNARTRLISDGYRRTTTAQSQLVPSSSSSISSPRKYNMSTSSPRIVGKMYSKSSSDDGIKKVDLLVADQQTLFEK